MSDGARQRWANAVLAEAQEEGRRLPQAFWDFQAQTHTIGLAIIAGFIYAAGQWSVGALGLLGPVLLLQAIQALWVLRELLTQGGVQKAREECVVRELGGAVNLWEMAIAALMQRCLANYLRLIVYGMAMVGATVISLGVAVQHWPGVAVAALCVDLATGWVTVVLFIRHCTAAHSLGYTEGRKNFRYPPPPGSTAAAVLERHDDEDEEGGLAAVA